MDYSEFLKYFIGLFAIINPCGILPVFIDFTDNMNMCIVIRKIIKKNNSLYLQAGGGIVMDSEIDKEFQETENKVMATFKALEV